MVRVIFCIGANHFEMCIAVDINFTADFFWYDSMQNKSQSLDFVTKRTYSLLSFYAFKEKNQADSQLEVFS